MTSSVTVSVNGKTVECVKPTYRELWDFPLDVGGLSWRVAVQRTFSEKVQMFYCYMTLVCESCDLALPDVHVGFRTASKVACECNTPMVNGRKNQLRKRGVYSITLGDPNGPMERFTRHTPTLTVGDHTRVREFLNRRGIGEYESIVVWSEVKSVVEATVLDPFQPWWDSVGSFGW